MLHFAIITEREHSPKQAALQPEQAFVLKRIISRRTTAGASWLLSPTRNLPTLSKGPCPGTGLGCAPNTAAGWLSLWAPAGSHSPTQKKPKPSFLSLPQQTNLAGGQHVAGVRGAAGTAVCCGTGWEHMDEGCSGHKSTPSQLGEHENRTCSCTSSGGPRSPSKTCKTPGSSLGTCHLPGCAGTHPCAQLCQPQIGAVFICGSVGLLPAVIGTAGEKGIYPQYDYFPSSCPMGHL